MGHTITSASLQPDPLKVDAIQKMPAPANKQYVWRLLGTANYLQRFASNLSDLTAPLSRATQRDQFVQVEQTSGRPLLPATKTSPVYSTSTQILWPPSAIRVAVQCLRKGPRYLPSLRRPTTHLCFQISNRDRTKLCPNRKRNVCHSVWHRAL